MTDLVDDIAAVIQRDYGVKVALIVQMKTVYGLVTEHGQHFIWKFTRQHDTERRLAQLSNVCSRLTEAGILAAGPLPNREDGFIGVLASGKKGYLQPWVRGRHLKVNVRQELLTAIATVAQFHQRAWMEPEAYTFDTPGGMLPTRLKSKRAAFAQALTMVPEHVPGLAELAPKLLKRADEAVLFSSYLEPELPTELCFCHRDLAPHNLLWQSDGRVGMIDFDRAGWDDPLLDLMQLFNHAMFLDNSCKHCLSDIVAVYARVRPLSKQRERTFYKLAGFPEHLTRALIEWARSDYTPGERVRVELALEKERLRQSLLEDAVTSVWF